MTHIYTETDCGALNHRYIIRSVVKLKAVWIDKTDQKAEFVFVVYPFSVFSYSSELTKLLIWYINDKNLSFRNVFQ